MAHITTDLKVLVYDVGLNEEYGDRSAKKLFDLQAFSEVTDIGPQTDKTIRLAEVGLCDVLVLLDRYMSLHAMVIAGVATERQKLVALIAHDPTRFTKYLSDPFDAIDTFEGISTWLMTTAPYMVKREPAEQRRDKPQPSPPIPDKPNAIVQAVHGFTSRIILMAESLRENGDTLARLPDEEDNTRKAPGMVEMYNNLCDEVRALGVGIRQHEQEMQEHASD